MVILPTAFMVCQNDSFGYVQKNIKNMSFSHFNTIKLDMQKTMKKYMKIHENS